MNERIIHTRLGTLEINNSGSYCLWRLTNDMHRLGPSMFAKTPMHEMPQVIAAANMKFTNIAFRRYGDPKLKRPKELKGMKKFGNVETVQKARSALYLKGNDLYVQCRDYFSPTWHSNDPKLMGAPLSALGKAFDGTIRSKEFIYPDGWGAIVLRSEAWLKVEELRSALKYFFRPSLADILVEQQKEDAHANLSETSTCSEWYRFWDEACAKLMRYMEKKQT